MRIDVVGTILRIVFENEYRGLRPEPLFDTASTIIPKAASLSAMAEIGVILPAAVPEV